MDEQEYNKVLKQYHKKSDRHILIVETDMSYSDVQYVVKSSDKLRKAKNELVAIMNKNYTQLIRTKRYHKLLKLYGKLKENAKDAKENDEIKEKRKYLAKQLNEMQVEYNVTWDCCRTSMIDVGKKYRFGSVLSRTIWYQLQKSHKKRNRFYSIPSRS